MIGRVAVLMASQTYADRMGKATAVLRELGVPVTEHILSAHRTPDETIRFAKAAKADGYAVIICGATQAAHLAGLVAAHTVLPVIGVPLGGSPLGAVDALYSTVQMPNGYPVATVAVDSGVNAGLLAAQIIGVKVDTVADGVHRWREERRLGSNKRGDSAR